MFDKNSQNTPVETCTVPETSKSFIIKLKLVLCYNISMGEINPSFVWKYHFYGPVNCVSGVCMFSTTNSQVSCWGNFIACPELS